MTSRYNINLAEEIDFDSTEDISVDFSTVDNIAIQDIRKIADIHRIAVLNGKKLYIKNAAPEVMHILEMTGLHKSFTNFEDQCTTPIKRQRRF